MGCLGVLFRARACARGYTPTRRPATALPRGHAPHARARAARAFYAGNETTRSKHRGQHMPRRGWHPLRVGTMCLTTLPLAKLGRLLRRVARVVAWRAITHARVRIQTTHVPRFGQQPTERNISARASPPETRPVKTRSSAAQSREQHGLRRSDVGSACLSVCTRVRGCLPTSGLVSR